MTKKEVDRIKVLTQVIEGKLSQVIAAKKLSLSERQIRRLIAKIKSQGDESIISKKRGKASNRCLPYQLKAQAISLLQNHYVDFGPQLANEYLKKEHQIFVSTETLRLWMIETHLWIPRTRRDKKLHPLRQRRSSFGELIQIDGSYHDWFEGRADPCVLMVFVDDATSMITSLHFSETESLQAYYHALENHLKVYGIPLSFYGDKCAVLAPRNPKSGDCTHFQKTLKELDCQLILAHSPQAKGRVERVNKTLQDRLVKELRLKGISSIEEANAMLNDYRERYNSLFSKKPNEQLDTHRSLEGICLEHVLSTRETRTLDNNYIVQFRNNFYQISEQVEKVHLYKGGSVEIRELRDGNRVAFFKGKLVKMTHITEIQTSILDEKQLRQWKPKKIYTPPLDHPYKKHYSYEQERKQKVV